MESDVYTLLRGPNIPYLRYRGMTGVITKLMPIEGTYILWGNVVFGFEGGLTPVHLVLSLLPIDYVVNNYDGISIMLESSNY